MDNPTVEEPATHSAMKEPPATPASSRNNTFVDDVEGLFRKLSASRKLNHVWTVIKHILKYSAFFSLDVCVQAIEEAIVDGNEPVAGSDEVSVATAASDVFSVASSAFTGVTEVLKAVKDARKDLEKDASFKSTDEVTVEDVGSEMMSEVLLVTKRHMRH